MTERCQMTFGSYLKAKRKEKGLTQEQVGEALNISKASVSKYEKDIFVPQVSVMKEYRELLGLSREEFYAALEGDNTTEPDEDQEMKSGINTLTPELLELMHIASKNRIDRDFQSLLSKIGGKEE